MRHLAVPLDYMELTAQRSTRLSPETQHGGRPIGSLIVNPGAGGSGVDYLRDGVSNLRTRSTGHLGPREWATANTRLCD